MDVKPSLSAALREDPRAREHFVAEHRVWAIRYARRRGTDQDAEDIAHAVLMDVIERPPDALDRVHPRAILAVKICDRVIEQWREQRKTARKVSLAHCPEPAQGGAGMSTMLWLSEIAKRVSSALRRLGTPERQLLTRRYLDGERPVDMAEDGETPAAVRGKVFRALDALRGEMPLES